MTERTPVHDLQVATDLYNFVNDEVLPDVGVAPGDFWHYFYFSVETLATVGYGDMHPQTHFGHVVATTEMFVGIFITAVLTGLIF